LTERSDEPVVGSYVMALRRLAIESGGNQMHKDDLAAQSSHLDSVEPAASDGPPRDHRRASTTISVIDEEVLTYREAA
jgi:hypothetical protein